MKSTTMVKNNIIMTTKTMAFFIIIHKSCLIKSLLYRHGNIHLHQYTFT